MPGASGCPLSLSASSGGCASARPSTRSISARGRPPGRSSIGRVKAADNGGFDADRDRAAVDDQVDPPVKVALHMGRRGRRDVTRQVGRRRHHRAGRRAQDFARDGVGGYPNRDGVEPGGGKIGHGAIRRLGQYQRQRPRPEGLRQRQRASGQNGRSAARRRGRRHGRSAD